MFLATSFSGSSDDGLAGRRARARPATVCSPVSSPFSRVFWLLLVVRNEAAIDEQETAVGKLQRRVDVKARGAVVGGEKMPFLVVDIAASHCYPAIFDIAASGCERLDIGQRHGRGSLTRGDIGEQAFLPLQALDLPGAERQQDGKHGQQQKRLGKLPGNLRFRLMDRDISHARCVPRWRRAYIAARRKYPCSSAEIAATGRWSKVRTTAHAPRSAARN